MKKYFDTVIDTSGDAIAGAVITVTKYPSGDPASIYNADNAIPGNLIDELVSSATGYFEFYAPDGRYTITISRDGYADVVISDVLIQDPTDDYPILITQGGTGATNAADALDNLGINGTGEVIVTGDIADDAITTAKIVDGAVTRAKLSSDTQIWNVVEVSFGDSPVTAQSGYFYNVNTSGGNVVINLPSIAAVGEPSSVGVKKKTSDANTVTVAPNGTDTIDGAANDTLSKPESKQYFADIDSAPDNWVSFEDGELLDGSVTTAKIADGAITTAKIATGSVVLSKLDTTGDAGKVLQSQGAGNAPEWAEAGKVIQYSYSEYTTYSSTTSAFPFDNTPPQNTEGTEFISASFTPKKATSKVRIRVSCPFISGSSGGSAVPLVAVFRSDSANAINAGTANLNGVAGAQAGCIFMESQIDSWGTSALTISVRYGPFSSGTAYINGYTTGALYGGAIKSTLIIEEMDV